jgi:hypothetical protein
VAGCARCPGLDADPADHGTACVDHHDDAPLDATDTSAAVHPAASPDVGAHAATADPADAAPESLDPARPDHPEAADRPRDAAVGLSALGAVRVVVGVRRTPVLLIDPRPCGAESPARFASLGGRCRRCVRRCPVTGGGLDPPPTTKDGRCGGPGWGGPDE